MVHFFCKFVVNQQHTLPEKFPRLLRQRNCLADSNISYQFVVKIQQIYIRPLARLVDPGDMPLIYVEISVIFRHKVEPVFSCFVRDSVICKN